MPDVLWRFLIPTVLAQGAPATDGASTGGKAGTQVLRGLNDAAKRVGYKDTNLLAITGELIKVFLSLLGIIFIGMILFAGYNWMTAMGEKEKVTKAKDTLISAAIGIVIIISAYAITTFVFKSLDIK